MVRTQIQLPDDLYRQLKTLAERREWTLAETIRRASEELLKTYPESTDSAAEWKRPVVDLGGPPRIPVSEWRELANEREGLLP